jgi:uncharacterized membrane protein
MEEFNSNQTQVTPQIAKRPMAVWIFGVLNIVVGCYHLVRDSPGLYKTIAATFKNPEKITSSEIFGLLLLIAGFGLTVWLLTLGAGLLTMKRWARRGSVMFARIMIVFIVITLGSMIIAILMEWSRWHNVLNFSINNCIAVINWIYYVLLLIFMQTQKVKNAFAVLGG